MASKEQILAALEAAANNEKLIGNAVESIANISDEKLLKSIVTDAKLAYLKQVGGLIDMTSDSYACSLIAGVAGADAINPLVRVELLNEIVGVLPVASRIPCFAALDMYYILSKNVPLDILGPKVQRLIEEAKLAQVKNYARITWEKIKNESL
jgi:hypothetical protein